MIVCNIQLQNKKDSFIKKSYSIPVGIFPGNKATIDDKGNIYVATGMLGVVQKFNKNGDFIKSILIKDDIDMIKNERDGIHVYAGKFDYTDYHIMLTSQKLSYSIGFLILPIGDFPYKINVFSTFFLQMC